MRPRRSEFRECYERGIAALARADLPGCKAAFQRCVELDPGSLDAWFHLGVALAFKEPAEARQALDRALALQPDHQDALYWRAEVDWVQGDARSAAGWLGKLKKESRNLARLGFACISAGDLEAGRTALEEAVQAGGGTAAVAARQQELRRAIYLDVLGRQDEALRLVEAVNAGGPAPDTSAERYPRDLEEQRCALEDVVAGRDVVILGSGPSLERLPPLLAELGRAGCAQLSFFGFNNVPVAERMLRDAADRQVDVACMTSTAVMELHADWIAEFLGRTTRPSLFAAIAASLVPGRATADMISRHRDKVFYFAADGDHPPVPDDPLHFPHVNTLACVLPLAVLAQPRRIFLFGCDGAAPAALREGGDVYFRQGSAEYGRQQVASAQYARWLARDTFFFNAVMPTVLASLSVLHKVPVPEIYLCNPESAYRPYPRIDASEFLRLQAGAVPAPAVYPARLDQARRRLAAQSRQPRAAARWRAMAGVARRALNRGRNETRRYVRGLARLVGLR